MENKLNTVILCIGTSKCTGDSLGPLVGEYLYNRINKSNTYIFGNLKNNITFKNIDIILNIITKNIKNPYFMVIDSALSNKDNVGKFIVKKDKMTIGSALNRRNYRIGDLSIKGIVGENKNNNIKNYNELKNVPMNLIVNLSKRISNMIIKELNV